MADSKKIDTGTGGFPIEGNLYSYDTGTENDQKWNRPDKWNSGDVNVDQTQKDLAQPIKRTLAAYLSKTTMGKTPSAPSPITNSYPINHSPDQDPNVLSLTDSEGYAAPLRVPNPAQVRFENSWTPGDSRSSTKFNLQRGREKVQPNTLVDGNTLLRTITDSEKKTPSIANASGFNPPINTVDITQGVPKHSINDYYGNSNDLSNSMIYNRFNPDLQFGPYVAQGSNTRGRKMDDNSLSSRSSKIAHRVAKQFDKPGSYEPGKSPGAAAGRAISYGTLAQIGVALSMRASGELGSLQNNYNPTDGWAVAAAQAPGTAQLGLNIERGQLDAADVIANLDPNAEIPQNVFIDPASMSYGTLNNVNDEFTGLSSTGMQLLTAALLLSVTVSLGGLSLLFSIGSGSSPALNKKDKENNRYIFGQYYQKFPNGRPDTSSVLGMINAIKSGNFWILLGIEPTNFPLQQCLLTGLLMNFGVTEFSLSKIAEAAAASPGYYAILARAINRSILKIGDAFYNLGKAFTSFNPIGAVKQFLSTFEALKDSKFFKLANVFAQLGDRRLNDEARLDDISATTLLDDSVSVQRLGEDHSYFNNPAGNVRAWATHRAPDFLLLPKSLNNVNLAKDFGIPKMNPSANTLRNKSIYVDGGSTNRISTEDRELIEDSLEAEYVPFYIHDVRTNEIVSFHAFLASLTDSYTAQYDAVDGIGRVEAAKIYKSTSRKLDFSFWIVSTSPEDFDSMWLKINKLTTLVYPQFSKGRTISDANNSVYAPFSQLIQASPLVRVRIGDLVKSNYSKFNLARLFGYSYSDTMFNGKTLSKDVAQQKAINDKMRQYTAAPPVGTTWKIKEFPTSDDVREYNGSVEVSSFKKLLDTPSQRATIPTSGFVFEIMEVVKAGLIVKLIIDENEIEEFEKNNANASSERKTWSRLIGSTTFFLFTEELGEMTKKTQAKIIQEAGGGNVNPAEYDAAAKNFMSDDPVKGNAVVRSFRSAGGKGIAGFIESLNFEWPTDKQWEIGRGTEKPSAVAGRRAPYICKVSVNFSPIHDITPGLDHVGNNRAPIYPVGPLSFNDFYSQRKAGSNESK